MISETKFKEIIKRRERIEMVGVLLISMLITGMIYLSIATWYWHQKYNEAIDEGAKNVVTAIEMTVACQKVGNVTDQQIKEEFLKTFILGDKI